MSGMGEDVGPPPPGFSPPLLKPAPTVGAHLRVLRVDLFGIDFRITGYQAAPPLHLINL